MAVRRAGSGTPAENRRSYGEACPVAHALDIVGERWALLVVRELRLGPKRFTDLQASLPNAGPNVLSQRLRDLERVGVLRRRTLPPPAGSRVYELTEWGAELEPVFAALAHWGMRSPVVPRQGTLSADSVLLRVRTFFDSQGVEAWTATYAVLLGKDSYRIRVVDGRLVELTRADLDRPADATIACDRMTLHALLTRSETLAGAVDEGRVTLTGDPTAVQRLIDAVQAGDPAASRRG